MAPHKIAVIELKIGNW